MIPLKSVYLIAIMILVISISAVFLLPRININESDANPVNNNESNINNSEIDESNDKMTKEKLIAKLSESLRNVQKINVGKYHFQILQDYEENIRLLPNVRILLKVEFVANVNIDTSNLSPDDIVIDDQSKIIKLYCPSPLIEHYFIGNSMEIIHEDIPFYISDEEKRNYALELANKSLEEKVNKLKDSPQTKRLVEVFIKAFAKKLTGEDYEVFVDFK